MSLRSVLLWPDPRLSTPCEPVGEITDKTRVLAEDMLETMYAAPGRGLAAPQVGVLKRLFVMDATWKEGLPAPQVFVDPWIVIESDERVPGPEGCLSIPGVTTEVERALWVEMEWRDLSGAQRREKLTGFAAVCAQHELDHLNGLVTLDRLSDTARAEALTAYQEGAA